MKKLLALGVIIAAALAGPAFGDDDGDDDATILRFKTMVGVPVQFTGTQSPIRGINGGGLPWVVTDSAKGRLRTDGRLNIDVRGLVINPAAASPLAGTNPSATFRATVSCETVMNGAPAVVNVQTEQFPATTGPANQGGGDSRINAIVDLPRPCIAPIVFVTSPAGAWFAATGF